MMGIEIHIRSIYNWVLGDGSEGKKKTNFFKSPTPTEYSWMAMQFPVTLRAVRGGKRTVRSLSPGN